MDSSELLSCKSFGTRYRNAIFLSPLRCVYVCVLGRCCRIKLLYTLQLQQCRLQKRWQSSHLEEIIQWSVAILWHNVSDGGRLVFQAHLRCLTHHAAKNMLYLLCISWQSSLKFEMSDWLCLCCSSSAGYMYVISIHLLHVLPESTNQKGACKRTACEIENPHWKSSLSTYILGERYWYHSLSYSFYVNIRATM